MAICIFCPNEANSREDLFPRWILQRVHTGQPLVRQVGDQPVTLTDDQEVRVPCVCDMCNNGWMSRLEKKVLPYLGLMLNNNKIRLDKDYQKGLGEWALKGAMVADSFDYHDRYYTEAECHAFKANRTMPERTEVVIGHFTGRQLDSHANTITLVVPDGRIVARGHVFTVMVGHVVMQVKSMRVEPNAHGGVIKMKCNPGPWTSSLIQVWPIVNKRVDWPPPISFSTVNGPNHYGNFRYRWKRESGHQIITPKPKSSRHG